MYIQLNFVQTSCAKERYKVISFVFSGCWKQSLQIRTVVHPLLASYLQLEFCFAGEPQVIYYYFIICLLYIGIGVGNFSRYSDIINLLCRAKGRKPGLIDELKK